MVSYEELGRRLKALREMHGETQEQLADAIGTVENNISYYEHGKRRASFLLLQQIAKHYRVSMLYFTDEDERVKDLLSYAQVRFLTIRLEELVAEFRRVVDEYGGESESV